MEAPLGLFSLLSVRQGAPRGEPQGSAQHNPGPWEGASDHANIGDGHQLTQPSLCLQTLLRTLQHIRSPNPNSQQPFELSIIIIPILQTRKSGHREAEQFAHDGMGSTRGLQVSRLPADRQATDLGQAGPFPWGQCLVRLTEALAREATRPGLS